MSVFYEYDCEYGFPINFIRDSKTKEILIYKPRGYYKLIGPWEKRCPKCKKWKTITRLYSKYWKSKLEPKLCQNCQMKISVPKGTIKMSKKWYDKKIKNGFIIDPKLKDKLTLYKQQVWKYTNRTLKKYKFKNQDKRGRSGIPGAYHVDHKYSIQEGFRNDINPEILGSKINLHFIPWKENVKKQGKITITKEELLEGYKK